MDQESVNNHANQSGVIDSADMESIHNSQAYIDDLAHFADLAMQVERAEIIKALELYHANLVEIGNEYGPGVGREAIKMLEDLN